MITIVAINAKKKQDDTKTFFDNVKSAWDDKDNKQVRILHLTNIKELEAPAEDVIIFHPRASHQNPEWFKGVENFLDMNIEEEKYYVFGDDGGNILRDIENTKPEYKTCRFVKMPVGRGFRAIHAHVVAAILLWERFKKRGDIPSINEW